MIRIRALNEDGNVSDDESDGGSTVRKPTREVQEQEAMELYNSSFELVATGKYNEAISTIETILDLPFFEEDESKTCTPVQLQIKLGCLKTLSSIYYSLDPNPTEALKVFKMALTLDPGNVTLWYRLGQVAIKTVDLELAYYAFAQGFESNSNHWGCLENLITLSYVLFDSRSCLEYCALGLSKDPGFVRGFVFRDHIFRLQPSIKEDVISKWSILGNDYKYSRDWEQKYLSEVRNLLRMQTQKAEECWKREIEDASMVYICRHKIRFTTFAELCRVLTLLYRDAKKDNALLRHVELKFQTPEDTDTSDANQGSGVTENHISGTTESENGVDTNNGESDSVAGSALCNGDKSGDESQQNGTEKDQEEEYNRESNKKKKRDIKWWQIEGKRRSQRVRGHLFTAAANSSRPSKEADFATRLSGIIPKTLVDMDVQESEQELTQTSTSFLTSASLTSTSSQTYFGTDEEKVDVMMFVADHSNTNTMDLILDFTRFLLELSDREWPQDLANNFIQLYRLYRNHVPQPDPYSCDYFIQQSLPLECTITLIMLELYRESFSSIEKLKVDDTFNVNLFLVSELCRVIDDPILRFRFHWFLANYHFALAMAGQAPFSSSSFYLEELEEMLSEDMHFGICTRTDNVLSLANVRTKLSLIQRTENVNRITELYESKSYQDLIEILPFCAQLEQGKEGPNLTNRYYLADSYFQVQRYTESHIECLNIIKLAKLPANNQILHKTVLLLKRCVKVADYKIPIHISKETIRRMINLLVANRTIIPAILPISPWCILHTILFKLEQDDAALYFDEDSIPPSIQILQFAHEQLGRTGKCGLNKGKLLNYTLDSLLPLVSNEYYSDHENLRHCIEQAIYCLYGHPTRISKFRYLTEHGITNVTMEVSRGRELYEYYRPETLPEFDSYNSISEFDATLFLHIVTLIPNKPEGNFVNLKKYLSGETDILPLPQRDKEFDQKFIDIFYLLGDHYFKQKEWTKSTEYYTWDLALNPIRFDSWAGIALAKAEKITTLLNFCGNYTILEVVGIGAVCAKCFQNALELNPGSTKLSIEFGSFLYSMHSFCSRLLKQSMDQLSLEQFGQVELRKEEFLKRAAKCFEPAARTIMAYDVEGQQDELWIHHYMLGKVLEKLDPHTPSAFLEQYEMAGELLHQHGAVYPMKINYYSPPELAIEALEIYYRIHTSILNYVEKHDYNPAMEAKLLSFVERASESPFMQARVKRPESASESRKKRQDKQITAEVKLLMDDMLGRVEAMLEQEESQPNASESSTSQCSSSASSSDDSSLTSSGDDSSGSHQPPLQPTSFRLSVFQDMLRQNELRELRMVEAARIAEEKKKLEAKERAMTDKCDKSQPEVIEIIPTEEEIHFKDVKYGKVIARCLKAMQECITRFPAHHKSYFRISYTYSTYCKSRLNVARDWLLGNGNGSCILNGKKKILGLFGDRKPSNFFNGIWRNPIDDIDRPGSFPYHMSKTVQNVVEVLSALDDHEMLTEIGIQLSKVPDSDKKYLQNSEREQFSKQALTSAYVAARRRLSDAESAPQDVALGIYASYLKIQKNNVKENGMGPVLVQAYEKNLASKGLNPEPVSLEYALKYYQHLAWTTKLKTSHRRKPKTSERMSTSSETGRALAPPPIKSLPTAVTRTVPQLASAVEHVVIKVDTTQAQPVPTAYPTKPLTDVISANAALAAVATVTPKDALVDPARKMAMKRLSFAPEEVTVTKVVRVQTPPKTDPLAPPTLPQVNTKTIVRSIASKIQGKNGVKTVKKRPLGASASGLHLPKKNSISGEGLMSKSGREVPNLMSIPKTTEEYLKQLQVLYGFQFDSALFASVVKSNAATTSKVTVTPPPRKSPTATVKPVTPTVKPATNVKAVTTNVKAVTTNLKAVTTNVKAVTSNVKPTTGNVKPAKSAAPKLVPAPVPLTPSTAGTEEFILPDLLENYPVSTPPLLKSANQNQLPSTPPPTAQSSSAALMNPPPGVLTNSPMSQKYIELTAQAHEAMMMFEKTKAIWDKNPYKPQASSLFTSTPAPVDTALLSKYTNFFMAPQIQNDLISKFQINTKVPTSAAATVAPSKAQQSADLGAFIRQSLTAAEKQGSKPSVPSAVDLIQSKHIVGQSENKHQTSTAPDKQGSKQSVPGPATKKSLTFAPGSKQPVPSPPTAAKQALPQTQAAAKQSVTATPPPQAVAKQPLLPTPPLQAVGKQSLLLTQADNKQSLPNQLTNKQAQPAKQPNVLPAVSIEKVQAKQVAVAVERPQVKQSVTSAEKQQGKVQSAGSIVLEGETVPVYGYAGDTVQSKQKQGQDMRKRVRSGNTAVNAKVVPSDFSPKEVGLGLKMKVRRRSQRQRPYSPPRYRSPPPPTPVPMNSMPTFVTSPFKAQTTMVSNPGQFIKARQTTNSDNRRVQTPPAAHSANKTPPHAGSAAEFPEIIDLTTKSPVKVGQNNTGNVPTRGQGQDAQAQRPAKRQMPQMIAIGNQSRTDSPSPSTHPLPPKKKLLAMKRLENGTSPRSPKSTSTPTPPAESNNQEPEIITID